MVYAEIRRGERLGNWMFIWAAAKSLDDNAVFSNTGAPVSESHKAEYAEVFRGAEIVREIPKQVVEFVQTDWEYRKIPMPADGSSVHISGMFQSEKYFDIPKVRRLFAISPDRRERLTGKYGNWLSRANVTSVHVRRGDYMNLPHLLPFVGERYLKDAIRRIPECRDFIVCSDDMGWCRRFFGRNFRDRNFLFADGDSALDHLYLQSLCCNNIISNSTFGWWGAWLNNHPEKRVLAPSMWFGPIGPKKWNDIYFQGIEVVRNNYSLGLFLHAQLMYWGHRIRVAMGLCE